jgi:TRAP-type mannitol/chloroaromatic compound transport system permease small subunit
MNANAPVVSVEAKTVVHGGRTFVMRPLAEDSYTIMEAGVPVGRAVFTFGAANAVAESDSVTEDFLYEVAEAWFAALEA